MPSVHTAHTADLDPGTLTAARELLRGAFDGDFDDHDWEHALGGIHALIRDGAELVGHASVVQRRLVHGGRALRAGYVEGVAVRADRRGRGYGTALMRELERVIRSAYDVGALGATDAAIPLYQRLGWEPWRGSLFALTPVGLARTEEEDGAVFVLVNGVPVDLDAPLACDWRNGSVW